MISCLALFFRVLAGFMVAVAGQATAQARQVELMQFGKGEGGGVIDVGRRGTMIPPVRDGAPVDPEGLRADFASLSQPKPIVPAAATERSTIPVPLWMRTGQPAAAAFEAVTMLSAANVRIPACALVPYTPRGDLTGRVEQRRANLYPLVTAVACEAGVPAGLFDALIAQESGYDPTIVSHKGAVGLTQLMPGTAMGLGVLDSRDPLQNLRGGARYLRAHLDEFRRVDLALAAYNAGPGRVRNNRRVPPIAETIGYVAAVIRGWSTSALHAASPRSSLSPWVDGPRRVQLLASASTAPLPSRH